LPALRGLRGLPGQARRLRSRTGQAAPGVRAGSQETAAPDAWRPSASRLSPPFDDSRLVASYRLATLILRDRDEAEDATQEAIARAWSSWETLRDTSRIRRLVRPDPRQTSVGNRMRHIRTMRVVALDAPMDAPAADSYGRPSPGWRWSLPSPRLTPEQRIIVVLRFWRDLPVEEIAERLGVPAGTVKSRLHYALKSLRAALSHPRRPAE